MAIKIDSDLLVELGLAGLPDAEKNSLLRHIYETLEMRVGMRLADQMSNEQLDEFEKYFDAKDDAGAFKWLESNFPNYKDIVQEEFDKLKGEIKTSAPQILAASAPVPAAVPPAPAVPAPTPPPAAPQPPVTSQPQQPTPQPQQFVPAPGFESPQPQQPQRRPAVEPWQPPTPPAAPQN